MEENKELWIWLVVQGNLEANDYQCDTLISTLTLIRTWLVILGYEGWWCQYDYINISMQLKEW